RFDRYIRSDITREPFWTASISAGRRAASLGGTLRPGRYESQPGRRWSLGRRRARTNDLATRAPSLIASPGKRPPAASSVQTPTAGDKGGRPCARGAPPSPTPRASHKAASPSAHHPTRTAKIYACADGAERRSETLNRYRDRRVPAE